MKREYDDERLPLSGNRPVAEDVRRELAFHLEQRVRELMHSGKSREEAIAEARASFGDSAAVEAECKAIERRRRAAIRRADRLEALGKDIVVGLRVLRKNPGFAFMAVVTLALGTGAVAAMFSIVNRVLLRPLPYPDPDRLVAIVERHESGWGNLPWANFLDLEARSHSFVGMASYASWPVTVLGAGQAIRVKAGFFSAGFFKVFPVRPVVGRLPLPEVHRLGAAPVVVVSHQFWRDVLGAPQSLEAVRLRLDQDYQVVGVLPPGFEFPDGNQIWRPMELTDQSMSRTSHNWDVVGRLKPGFFPGTAQRELDNLLAQLKPQYYPDFDAVGATVTGLQEAETGALEKPLYLLLAASGVFLLAACTNLASGILARGTARLGELTVRSALGATRKRLARQLLTESAILAVLGGVAGLLLSVGLLRALRPLAPASLRMEQIGVDGWVAAFALGLAVLTTLLFGLFPALRLSGTSTILALREASIGSASARRIRAWNVLVASEVALAVALLSGSMLLIKSFGNLMATKLGFEPAGLVALTVDLPSINYTERSPRVADFHERALARIKLIPGVEAVGFTNVLPLLGSNPSGSLRVEGKPLDPRGPFNAYAIYRVVGGDYFKAMGIPIVEGRAFGPGDDAAGPLVVIVDEEFAKQEWSGQEPLGKRVKVAGMDSNTEEPWVTVVGVAGNVRAGSIVAPYQPTYYFDHRQRPPYRTRAVTYAVRTGLPPSAVFPALRAAIRAIDPEVPVVLRPMEETVAQTVTDKRFTMEVLGAFAALALLLALVGIYGVVSYAVAQRTREIGVRRALGATPRQLSALVLGSTLVAVVPGLIVGALLTLANAGALGAFLYGVSPFDPATLALAVGALGGAALLASLVPAWRAVRVDPLIAMRAE